MCYQSCTIIVTSCARGVKTPDGGLHLTAMAGVRSGDAAGRVGARHAGHGFPAGVHTDSGASGGYAIGYSADTATHGSRESGQDI